MKIILKQLQQSSFLKLLIILILFSQLAAAKSAFRSEEDREITLSVIKKFSRECPYLANSSKSTVDAIEKKFNDSQDKKQVPVTECYNQNISKISATYYAYKKLCDDLTENGIPADDLSLMKSLLAVEKYKDGIFLQHSLLNDCLRQLSNAGDWTVPSRKEFAVQKALSEELKKMRVPDPYLMNGRFFR